MMDNTNLISLLSAHIFVHILDVTQEDIDELLQQAIEARNDGKDYFYCQGQNIRVADIFEGTAEPVVQAIEQLHAIRLYDHRHGCYRDAKL